MSFVLRPLGQADYAAYLDRIAELDALHREALPDIFRAPDDEPLRTVEYFEAQLADPSVLLLGAWIDDELAGFAHAISREVEQRWIRVGRRYVVIDNIAVGPRWQRRGLGAALVDAIAEWARQRGAQQLELDVWEANRGAAQFYEDIGFEVQRRHFARRL
ncbi:MAG TPA: GNAT family N-acetyltransferase [Enhygromyxa sp.]|nr:GNAT family N-acetyltransferase [Enhygromyxa sp.]